MSQAIDDFMSLNTTFPFSFPASTESPSSWSFPLYNKEIFTKSTFKDYESMVLARFENDKARIKQKASRSEHPDYDEPYSMTVFNTHGIYIAVLKVGGLRQELVLDLGSSLIWWNCKPCKNCPKPKFGQPRYDPKESLSYGVVPCRTFWCDINRFKHIDGCDQLTSHTCLYRMDYVDRSYSKGELGFEKLTTTLNDHIADRIVFGCSRELSKDNSIIGLATGILGLDQGDFSMIRQLNVTNFTMCLPTFNHNLASSLKLHYIPDLRFVADVTTAPLVDNPYDTNYFVGLNGIYVGGVWLSIPTDVWDIKAYADGGVLLDTGSYLSWLPAAAYYPFRDTFRKTARSMGLRRAKGIGVFDTCYIISSTPSSTSIPSVGFGFRDVYFPYFLQADQILELENNKRGKYCLAFAKNEENYTMIGAFQLQRTRLAFDLATKVVNLLPNDCK